MRNRKPRRFRHRSNGRGHQARINGGEPNRLISNSFTNGRIRNNVTTQYGAERLVEKYNMLAKEALSTGDKVLSENYFQHAEHFARIVDEKASNQRQVKPIVNDHVKAAEIKSTENPVKEQDQAKEEKK